MQKTIVTSIIIIFFVIIASLIGAVLWGIGSYNNLVALKQDVDAQWAEVQNQYQRRSDLIPNLVQTVSGAANFEKATLTDIVQARASVGQVHIDPNQAPTDPAKLQEFVRAQNTLGTALSRLLVVSERYPELKANQNFQNLQAQLEGTENRITTARNHFNQSAQAYNTKTKTFPTVLLAGAFGFTERPYFQAKEGSEAAPAVQFNFNEKK